MTDTNTTQQTDAKVGAGSVVDSTLEDSLITSPTAEDVSSGSTTQDSGVEKNKVKKEKKSNNTPKEEKKEYYNVKIPTFTTAFKSLWKGGKKVAKKAEPVADKILDKLAIGIAKMAGLPDPKTGKKNSTTEWKKNKSSSK